MASIELGSRWKMPDGQVWVVGGFKVDPFETTVLCTLERFKDCVAHWPARSFVEMAEKQHDPS